MRLVHCSRKRKLRQGWAWLRWVCAPATQQYPRFSPSSPSLLKQTLGLSSSTSRSYTGRRTVCPNLHSLPQVKPIRGNNSLTHCRINFFLTIGIESSKKLQYALIIKEKLLRFILWRFTAIKIMKNPKRCTVGWVNNPIPQERCWSGTPLSAYVQQ